MVAIMKEIDQSIKQAMSGAPSQSKPVENVPAKSS